MRSELLLAGLALAGFAVAANPQTPEVLGTSHIKRVRSVKPIAYDFAGQKVVRHGVPQKSFSGTFCYVDTDTVGFYTSTTLGTTFIDWV